VVAHAFNPSIWEAEAGGFLSSRLAWSTKWVPGQPRRHKETLSRKNKNKNKKPNQNKKPLWERSWDIKLIPSVPLMNADYRTKDMLFGGKGSVFVLTGKEKRFWTPSRVIWIRWWFISDRKTPEDFSCRKEKFRKIK
jgi:hypothetical protein